MGSFRSLLDVTNTVSLGDAAEVAGAADRMLTDCFGAGRYDGELLHASFTVVERLFAGDYPGYLACDMPYHDLRHSLDAALVMARLVNGFQREHGAAPDRLSPAFGLLGVLLALLHDTGFLRKTVEALIFGPQLAAEHESRSVEFAGSYLQTTSLANCASLAPLILATRLASDPDKLLADYEGPAVTLGRMLGTADLVCQMADRCYLERCYYHLYPELVVGGRDRVRTPDGHEQLLYRDAFELLCCTPRFYESVVRKRLDPDFQDVARYLRVHLGGVNTYAEAIACNIDRSARIVAEGRPTLLGLEPATTTSNLAPIYHGTPPRPTWTR